MKHRSAGGEVHAPSGADGQGSAKPRSRGREGAAREESPCTRCGREPRHPSPFPEDASSRNAVLCEGCRGEWIDLLKEVARRWHGGLRRCFFCSRPLGDQLFPARSALGACCAECGVALAALISDRGDVDASWAVS